MQLPINTIIFVLFLAGVVVLQVFLSKRQSRWPGLVLPAISLFIALWTALNMMIPPGQTAGQTAAAIIGVFLMCNIPTLVLLGIYAACREKFKKNREIEKMNIQDLE